jgi:hypothetical protein
MIPARNAVVERAHTQCNFVENNELLLTSLKAQVQIARLMHATRNA